MKQGEIWDIEFNPIKGSEQGGRRPGVIISGNAMNDNFNLLIVCPITAKIKGYMGNLILERTVSNDLKCDSEVLVFHVRSISKSRITKKRGTVTDEQLRQIKNNLNEVLTF